MPGVAADRFAFSAILGDEREGSETVLFREPNGPGGAVAEPAGFTVTIRDAN